MENRFRLLLLGTICIHLFSCGLQGEKRLENEASVTALFNTDEIATLKQLVEYFDKMVLSKTTKKSIEESYNDYFKNVYNEANGYNDEELFFVGTSDYILANNPIEIFEDNPIFDEIWFYSVYGRYDTELRKHIDSAGVGLQLNPDGRYMKLLYQIQDENEIFEGYYKCLIESGDISPSCNAGLINSYDKVNFKRELVRLIWAIHFTTVFSNRDYIEQGVSK